MILKNLHFNKPMRQMVIMVKFNLRIRFKMYSYKLRTVILSLVENKWDYVNDKYLFRNINYENHFSIHQYQYSYVTNSVKSTKNLKSHISVFNIFYLLSESKMFSENWIVSQTLSENCNAHKKQKCPQMSLP